MTKAEARANWRRALDETLHGSSHLEEWQLDLAAEIFASELPDGSITGKGDIWVVAQTAGQTIGNEMVADGRLHESGNWPRGHPRHARYYEKYFVDVVFEPKA